MQEKGLSLKLDAENIPPVKADAFKIEQVFINLLDNAVKYTDKGGVSLAIKKSGSSIVIEIEDTGIGIPKEHLPRIFERFYVVDKSRAQETRRYWARACDSQAYNNAAQRRYISYKRAWARDKIHRCSAFSPITPPLEPLNTKLTII